MENKYFEQFTKPVRKIGKTCMLAAIIIGFLPALYIGLKYDAMPTAAQILGGYALIASTEVAYYFIEPISYFPVLGEAGTYMSFLAGSIGGIRIPAVSAAQEAVGTEPGSQKAEIVSTIAIAASIICSMMMGFIAILIGNVLFAVMPPFVQTMFNYVLPAIYGSLIMMYLPKAPANAVVALAAAMFLRMTGIIPSFFNMLVTVAISVVYGIVVAKKKAK